MKCYRTKCALPSSFSTTSATRRVSSARRSCVGPTLTPTLTLTNSDSRSFQILFLSTCPALPAKLATSPLSAVYPDYDGGNDYASALRYIRRHFAGMNSPGRMLYVYLVDLMDEGYLRRA